MSLKGMPFITEINLSKPPLKFNGRLANLG